MVPKVFALSFPRESDLRWRSLCAVFFAIFMNYLGLDWLAMAGTFTAVALIGAKRRYGFLVFVGANLTWITFGSLAGSPAIVAGNSAFLIINLRSFLRWRQEAQHDARPEPPPVSTPFS